MQNFFWGIMSELIVLQISHGISFQKIEETVKPQIMNTFLFYYYFYSHCSEVNNCLLACGSCIILATKNETAYLAIFLPLLFPLFPNKDYFECLQFIDSWYLGITPVRLVDFAFLIFTESLALLLLPNMENMTGLGRSCGTLECSQGSKEQAAQSFQSIVMDVTLKIIWFSTGRVPSSWPGYPEPPSSLTSNTSM